MKRKGAKNMKPIVPFKRRRNKCLNKLLRKWIDVNIAFADRCPNVPWDTERACISILAAAAWRSGGFAHEEYSAEKRSRDGRKKDSLGREDIYLKLDGHQFIGEAKNVSVPLTASNPFKKIERRLSWARAAVRRCHTHNSTRLGITFVQPFLRLGNKKKQKLLGLGRKRKIPNDREMRKLIRDWFKKIAPKSRKGNISCAGAFPGSSRFRRFGKRLWPGVAIFIQKV